MRNLEFSISKNGRRLSVLVGLRGQLAGMSSYSEIRCDLNRQAKLYRKMSTVQVIMLLQLMSQLIFASRIMETVTLRLDPEPPLIVATYSPVLPSGYVAFPEIGFAYKMSTNETSVNGARETCLEEHGQLAVIESREKVQKILDHFGDGELIWVGLGQFYGTGNWITIDGKSTNNLPWADGEPNGDHGCAVLSRQMQGLRNMPCTYVYGHLCEIALPQN